jgi:threonine/homoserine/homoserine lactone efflux protein
MLEIAGIELLPDWPVFLSFAIAGLALNIVPGADMAFIMTASARGGSRAGIIAALGIGAGALFHVVAAVLGLSAILAASQAVFTALKWIGAAYLLYIAVSMLRAAPKQVGAGGAAAPPDTGWRLFRSAMLVNMLNPKVALFFLAFLPQFVSPDAVAPGLQILFLGLWFDLAGTVVNCLVAVGTAQAAARLRTVQWVGRAARCVAATIMGGLAVKLALSDRS